MQNGFVGGYNGRLRDECLSDLIRQYPIDRTILIA